MVTFYRCIAVYLVLLVLVYGRVLKKRQIFREQLQPGLGGKVPDSAFATERLALNRLNSKGIYSSSGIYLEERHDARNHEHATPGKEATMKVRVPPEQGYVAPQGRYHHSSPPTIDTTYLIRDPVSTPAWANLLHQSQPLIPYTSLKLRRYYSRKKSEKNKESPWDDVENDFSKVKREYEPYLKKLHEMD